MNSPFLKLLKIADLRGGMPALREVDAKMQHPPNAEAG
jgi:hypothetical protein